MLIYDVVALYDPYGVLPGLQWQTRDRLKTLASRFEQTTGLLLRTRRLGGRRTCGEQNQLYAQGRGGGGDIVTYASGCTSWHVLGRALDVDVINRAGSMQPESAYRVAGQIWHTLGGVWGGTFPGFPDIGHFEYHPGLKIEDVCPSATYCDAVQAGVQTSAPFSRYAIIGAVAALMGYAGWSAWRSRIALAHRFGY